MRICNSCKVEKPLSEYYKNKCGKNGIHNECIPCNKARAKKWALDNPEKRRERDLRKYGITLQDFYALKDKQNNKCAICDKQFIDTKQTCVDHCHTTKKVRGLLCHDCNFGLGKFRDSIQSLTKAIEYLSHGETKP